MSQLADFVAEQIGVGRFVILDDFSSEDEVEVITPCGSVNNQGVYRQFPILGICDVCLGATICYDDNYYCYHHGQWDTHNERIH
jgi:hypothetical protein